MNTSEILPIIQITVALLLIVSILFQNRGAGLSATFGGGDGAIKHTKRGFEKFLAMLTIALAVLYIVSTFASLIIE